MKPNRVVTFPGVLRLMAGAVLAASAGCYSAPKAYDPDAGKRHYYMPSYRTAAAEPVYSRTRWVHPPEVLPQREMPGDDVRFGPDAGPALRPVFHLALKDASLEETARVLGALARYSSFTAPSVATKKLSIENLGTIDELAELIARKAQIEVVIDHEQKEVRFLAPSTEEPRLFSE